MPSQQLPIIDTGVRTFRVPTNIMTNRNLRTLSGNALALFIAVSHRCYRKRSAEIRFSLIEIFHELGINAEDVRNAAEELCRAGVLQFECNTTMIYFQILNPDGSKAHSYLREYGESTESDPPKIEVARAFRPLGTSAATVFGLMAPSTQQKV